MKGGKVGEEVKLRHKRQDMPRNQVQKRGEEERQPHFSFFGLKSLPHLSRATATLQIQRGEAKGQKLPLFSQ